MAVEKVWQALTKSGTAPAALGWLIAMVPVACAFWLVYSSSVNAVGNDYATLVPRMGRMIEPGYDWSKLARDSSMSSHCLLIPMLLHLTNIYLFKWNIPLELYTGLVLCFLRVLVLDKLINGKNEAVGERSPLNAFLLVVLFTMSFGAGNVSVFMYNLTAIAYGITFLSFIAGLYSLYTFGNTRKGLTLMALAGFATSFSNGGSAMFSWIAYGLFIASQARNKRIMGVVTCIICLVATMGSITYLIHAGGIEKGTLKAHLPDVRMYLHCFALPFLKQTISPLAYTTTGVIIGATGWIMAAALILLVAKERLFTPAVGASLALAAYTAMNIFAVTAFRTTVAPWYATFADLFWFGILGLSFSVATSPRERPAIFRTAVAVTPLCLTAVMFLASNLTYIDKDSFRESHSPASEAAMRDYLHCPTYGEANLFSFTIGAYHRVPDICRPLAHHSLTCFAGRKNILLQGDYLFPQVRNILISKDARVFWIAGQSLRQSHEWREPQHLNLALSEESAVVWPFELSASDRIPTLHTKYCRVDSKRRGVVLPAGRELNGEITVYQGRTNKLLWQKTIKAQSQWTDFDLDLAPYGHSFTIKFAAAKALDSAPPHCALVFEAPQITLGSCGLGLTTSEVATQTRPANTELAADFRKPATGGANPDQLWPQDQKLWDKESLETVQDSAPNTATYKAVKALAAVTYKPALSLPVNSVDRFYIECSVPAKISPRTVCCQMVINGSTLSQIFIPLLDDDKMHCYTYDLKLCNFLPGDQITGFKVLPIFTTEPGQDCNIALGNIGFLKP